MGKKKKRKKRKPSSNDPIQCTDCPNCVGSMEKIAKNYFRSKYVCKLHKDKQVPMAPLTLIPKWCPKGYKNLFDL